jgi:integrase
MFVAYLRPSEALKIRSQDLVQSDKWGKSWALNLNPSETADPSKVGLTDESLLLDSPEVKYLGKALMKIRNLCPNLSLFQISYSNLLNHWKAALVGLGLKEDYAVPHQLRHSGASWDRMKRHRPLLEIKLRGRWASDTSLKRYENHARIAQLYEKLPKEIKKRAEASPELLSAMVTVSLCL